MKSHAAHPILAALLLTVLAATACASESDGQKDTVTLAEKDSVGTVTEETTEETTVHYTDALKTQDFGGVDFRIYTTTALVGMTLPTTINYASETTGEVVNDTLFARDLWISENYNVNMEYTVDTLSPRNLTTAILASDAAYDLIIHDLAEWTRNLADSNCIYPLNKIDTIRLDQPYWMPELNEQLKIGGNLIYSSSAISPRFYGSVYVILYNRDLAANLDLGDMYALVSDGGWTIDRMMEYSRMAYADLNGDGKYDDNDRVGMFYEVLTPESMVMGAGYHYVVNDNGQLKVMLEDEKLVTLMQRMAEFFGEDCCTWDNNDPKYDVMKVLNAGNFLFYNPCTFNLADLRDLSCDYGILPMPKESEAQKLYYGYSQPWASANPMIPITAVGDHLSMVGTLTDAMAAYGYDYLRPAVYENVIQLKGTRDERSAEIIDLMFENVTYELTSILEFGKLDTKLSEYFTKDHGRTQLASLYASLKSSVEKEVQKTVEKYAGLDDILD